MSFSNTIAENSPPGTTVAVINAEHADAGKNGVVHCSINPDIPFRMESSMTDYYSLATDGVLDRESISEYVTINVSDDGTPILFSNKTVTVKVTDVNDNPPAFDRCVYEAFVPENNSPGISIFTIRASDADSGQNARLSYYLENSEINGAQVSSLVSVNSENGVIHNAVRSLDYERIKDFQFRVKAQDGGSPPLSSKVTLKIIIQDQNDNAPQVLYPVQTSNSLVAEMVPRSADVGYLVIKVVAVDVDSGQNALLSYKLQKVTDRVLFEVGLQNGETRQVTDKDALKQRITVVVEDNGQPSRSATVTVNVAVANSFPEVISEFTDFTHDTDYSDNLTFYLVLALAVVSFLFISCVLVIISVNIYRWRQSRMYQSTDAEGTGTLQHMYNYEVCMTTDSRKIDCKFARPFVNNGLDLYRYFPTCTKREKFPRFS
uniref:Cadherin domain-containing protein n=1 Tax=Oncorhynchus mykiss TaxID=8022 RepID=A0A8K9WS00_ONCMY